MSASISPAERLRLEQLGDRCAAWIRRSCKNPAYGFVIDPPGSGKAHDALREDLVDALLADAERDGPGPRVVRVIYVEPTQLRRARRCREIQN